MAFIRLCSGRSQSASGVSVRSTDELFFVFMLRPDNGNAWNVPKQNIPQSKIAKNCTFPRPKPTRAKKRKVESSARDGLAHLFGFVVA